MGGAVIFKGNLNKNDLAKFIHISDALTTEILEIWSEMNYDDNITSTENLLSASLAKFTGENWKELSTTNHGLPKEYKTSGI